MATTYPQTGIHRQAGLFSSLTVFPGPPTADPARYGPKMHRIVLPVNPDYQYTQPYRTTPTQTIQGAYVDDFGLGVAALTLSGHTGWAIGVGRYNGQPVDGWGAIDALWHDILDYYFDLEQQQATQAPQVTMLYRNDADELHLSVKPTGNFVPSRSKAQPYLYQFQVPFIVLADLNHGGLATTPVPDPIDPGIRTTAPLFSTGGGGGTTSPLAQALPSPSRIWIVKPGDTVWTIVIPYLRVPLTDAAIAEAVQIVAQANHLANANVIYPGQRLLIPPLP
jgi:hypothetical protein